MLSKAKLQTIIWTSRIVQATAFYADVLGLIEAPSFSMSAAPTYVCRRSRRLTHPNTPLWASPLPISTALSNS